MAFNRLKSYCLCPEAPNRVGKTIKIGCTAQTWAHHVDIGSGTKEITLPVERCTTYSVTEDGGLSAITLWSGSAMWGEGGGNPTPATGGWDLVPGANVASLLNFCEPGTVPKESDHVDQCISETAAQLCNSVSMGKRST